jgi:hypothetical protein
MLSCLLFPSENQCVSQSSVLRSAELFDGQQPDRIFKSLQGSTTTRVHMSPLEDWSFRWSDHSLRLAEL